MEMEVSEAEEYFNAMPVLHAQEMLSGFVKNIFPIAKKNKRKELWNKYSKMANPDFGETRTMSSEEVAKALSRIV